MSYLEWKTPIVYDVLSQTASNRDFSGINLITTSYGSQIMSSLDNANEKTYMYWNSPNCNLYAIYNKHNPILFQYTYTATQTRDVSLSIACDNHVTLEINNQPTSIVDEEFLGTTIDISMVTDMSYVFDCYCINAGGPAFFSMMVHDGNDVLFNTSKSTTGWKWKWANTGFFTNNIPFSGLFGGYEYPHSSNINTSFEINGNDVSLKYPVDSNFNMYKQIPETGFRFDYSGVSHDFSEVFRGYTVEPSIVFNFGTYNNTNTGYWQHNVNNVSLQSVGELDDTFTFACKQQNVIDGSVNFMTSGGSQTSASIMFWMKTTGTSINNLVYISNTNGFISIDHESSGLSISIQNDSATTTKYTTQTVDGADDIRQFANLGINLHDENWHHVCVCFKTTTSMSDMVLYIDGQYGAMFLSSDVDFLLLNMSGNAGSTLLKNATDGTPSVAEIAMFKIFTEGSVNNLTPQQIELIYKHENPSLNQRSASRAYIPVVDGLTRLFIAPNDDSSKWFNLKEDISHADLCGNIYVGYNHSDVSGLGTYGSYAVFPYWYGYISSSVTVPITDMSNGNYTVFHISRYHNKSTGHHSVGGNRGRIWDGGDESWISGHHYNTNVADGTTGPHIGITNDTDVLTNGLQDTDGNLLDEYWILSTDIGTKYKRTYIDPATLQQKSDEFDSTRTNPTTKIAINNGDFAATQSSDWACAFMAIYDRVLSEAERVEVENYLFETYFKPTEYATKAARTRRMEQYVPITEGMVGLYVADISGAYTSTWKDQALIADGIMGGTGTVDVSLNPVGEFGSDISFAYIYGDTTTTLDICGNWPGSEYTFVHISRYTSELSSNRQRIWDGTGNNWLSGFHVDKRGVFFHGPGVAPGVSDFNLTSDGYPPVNDWLLAIDQPQYVKIRDTITDVSIRKPTATASGLEYISINNGTVGSTEPSDWACAFAALYDRVLSEAELITLQDHLYKKYFVNVPDPSYYWDFRVTTGAPVTDYRNSTITATLYGDAYYNDVSGLIMDGSGDYVELTPFEFGGVFSIETYFVMDMSNVWQRIIDFGDGSNDNNIILSRYYLTEDTLHFNYRLKDEGNNGSSQNTSGIVTRSIHHVVATIEQKSGDIYMNTYIDSIKGTEVVHSSRDLPTLSTRLKYYVGESTFDINNQGGKGSISYLRLWQGHALTQYEVNELYKQRNSTSYYNSSTS